MKNTRFNKNSIESLVRSGQTCTVKDTLEKGLRVKVGARRCVFQYEKRIAGSKGTAVTFTIGPFPTYSVEEARQEARRLATLCEKGIDPRIASNKAEEANITVEVAISRFWDAKQALRKRVLRVYKSTFNYVPRPWLTRQLGSISAEMIAAQFREIHRNVPAACWDFLKLMHNLWNTCSVIFYDESGQPILGQNPVIRAKQLLNDVRKAKPKRSVISIAAVGKFVVAIESLLSGSVKDWPHPRFTQVDRKMAHIAMLALFTGFRFNELRNLTWENVNLEKGYLFLPGEASKEGGFQGTKNHRDHYIALSSYAWDLLREIEGERNSSNPYVFSGSNPHAPCARSQRVFKYLSKQIGNHFSPHTARRTFASVADEIGLGFLTVKRLLNHAFEGGVTGGYVVASFNPVKERVNFQKVCDYILDQRAAHLGEDQESARFERLRQYAIELGFDPEEALGRLQARNTR